MFKPLTPVGYVHQTASSPPTGRPVICVIIERHDDDHDHDHDHDHDAMCSLSCSKRPLSCTVIASGAAAAATQIPRKPKKKKEGGEGGVVSPKVFRSSWCDDCSRESERHVTF